MARNFTTGTSTITLEESPWLVQRSISIYVKQVNGKLSIHDDLQSGRTLQQEDLKVYKGQSTGLYFFIAEGSDDGTQFPDPDSGTLPLEWKNGAPCPASVTYGKVKDDFSAFSIADLYGHTNEVRHSFNIRVLKGDGSINSTALFDEIDPTIVEKGEEPPSGG